MQLLQIGRVACLGELIDECLALPRGLHRDHPMMLDECLLGHPPGELSLVCVCAWFMCMGMGMGMGICMAI